MTQNVIRQKASAIWDILAQTFKNAANHNIPLHGAAIAFYTIFSIAPLLLIVLAAAELLLSEDLVRQQFFEAATQLWGAQITDTLTQWVDNYSRLPSSPTLHIITIGTLLFGATTVVSQLRSSLNTIWNVPDSEQSGVYNYILDRGISLLIILFISSLLVGSILLEVILSFLNNFLIFVIPVGIENILQIGLPTTSMLLSVVLFAILFKFLPDKTIRWKPVLVGAILTTLLFYGGKSLISFYLNSTSIQMAYRAAGSFIVFLIWIYYNVQIVLLGAEFTRVYSKHLKEKRETN